VTIADLLGRPSKLLLCFHAVDDGWPDPGLCVPVARFESAIAHFERAGYRGETFSTVVAAPPDERLVAVTFDDAFVSVATAAAPILEARGWPATVFVPTATLDGGGLHWIDPEVGRRHPAATRHLGPEHLRALVEQGWEVGSHSHTHPLLSRLSDADLREELAVSRDILSSIVGTCDSISYPWGEVDARVVEASRRAGYAAGSGLSGRFTWNDPMRAPRVAVSAVDDSFRFALKVSGTHWNLRATGVWPAVEAFRGMSGKRDEAPAPWRQRAVALLNLFNLH
jgi:peptidoglycan/xylan/chitin deacetylase (PgdA/CDA1 family)